MRILFLFLFIASPALADFTNRPGGTAYGKKERCEKVEKEPCFDKSVVKFEPSSLYKIENEVFVPDPVKFAEKEAADAARLAEEQALKAKLDAEKLEFEKLKEKLSGKEKLSNDEQAALIRYLLLKVGEKI